MDPQLATSNRGGARKEIDLQIEGASMNRLRVLCMTLTDTRIDRVAPIRHINTRASNDADNGNSDSTTPTRSEGASTGFSYIPNNTYSGSNQWWQPSLQLPKWTAHTHPEQR